ncbi:MAG: alternate F1F0 ATPase, F1 subunit alpha [Gammaproteobacteria bacterium]|nr:alternate F1F0 ATPase, F1 subunit alpha [Gammaproteobacteria bacterium]NIR83987.1 alternate F1F0 ATPase, F1 subunit alpha [Gammaproteobacteria bacterium]NIR89131.1 alternate F1F0 ATPase, F1 subunit alpha [Gammaproteobacteria bacterium]NIU04933.1 alternate F1F0 ATPase, F1 subunit alpha [Gammaproteobacteria bacterium]NIV52099.1 alternate F1F0 ATPase, F1 subunit alpha [Gammaproteobacteria bacterium]
MALDKVLDDVATAVDAALAREAPALELTETGTVTHVGGGVARVTGLPGITAEELVRFPGGLLGVAINLEPDEIGVMLLGDSERLTAGSEVSATGRITDTPVGDALIGRVVDATGCVLDDGEALRAGERRPVEQAARPIMERAPVTVPLETGIKAVDALIPIGRGQRELIVGDRQTGKTSVAVDTIINQRDKNVVCIYCAIGQRGTAVARVVDTLRHHNALEYTIVMVASGDDPPGLQFITPYAAATAAEYFMERGRDALIIYDDLTRHARAYRELSLLLRRPPGREAYPGDIFYIHSRLLERSTHLRDAHGGGSITALPIVETQAQDISAYIPTNLISITDGQIYLSPVLFRKGLMPAIDVGKSVSRVGGKTQFPALRAVAGDLRLAYAQFEELETFARFATRLDEETRATIEHGRRVRELLKQPERRPLTAGQQVAVLHAVNEGLFDELAVDEVSGAERAIVQRVPEALTELCHRIDVGEALANEEWEQLLAAARDAVRAATGQRNGGSERHGVD